MNFLKPILILLLFPVITASNAHKFYVSLTKIEYVEEKQSLQIITKIFIDDLEDVLQQRYDASISIATKKETQSDLDYLKQYVSEKFEISVNGNPVEVEYIGREYEIDIVKIYMEVRNVSEANTLTVTSDLLTELFEEQQNIIHFRNKDTRRSLILEKDNPKGMLNFN